MQKRIIKPGDVFNNLTVIEEIQSVRSEINLNVPSITKHKDMNRKITRYRNIRYFLCKCSCGNTRDVSMSALVSGAVKGCRECALKAYVR